MKNPETTIKVERHKAKVGHTPGPWKVVGCDIASMSDNYFIASVEGELPDPYALDNARLIAAAPELLEACQALIASTVIDGQRFSMMPSCGAFAALDAAIAKATGET